MLSRAQTRLLFLVLLPAFLLAPFALYYFSSDFSSQRYHPQSPPHLKICNKTHNPHSINLLGPSFITSNTTNWEGRILCPGDAIGDLNGTYLTVNNCSLKMYHKDQIIWSPQIYERVSRIPTKYQDTCAISLQENGNIVLYKEATFIFGNNEESKRVMVLWDSDTDFYPVKTELRLEDQQLQIVQTFEDESQRLFYVDEDHQNLMENLGELKRIADKSLIKSYKDEGKTILQRNEYIGDLNGTHLILQTNCELQLRNKNKVIWSFAPSSAYRMNCNFTLQDIRRSEIGISRDSYRLDKSIVDLDYDERAIQSQIMLEEDRLIIIQTLEDGTTRRFYSEPGHNTELKLKKELRQIAKNNITVPLNRFDYSLTIKRLDYIGNLSGLHIILHDNCTFMLADGSQTLWEYSDKSNTTSMDCAIQISLEGFIEMKRYYHDGQDTHLLSGGWKYQYFTPTTEVQLALGNNIMILTLKLANGGSEIYHAGQSTRGTWFNFISEHPVKVQAKDKDKTMPVLGYIGNVHGVYAVLEETCNWVLYNKTQVVWESGVSKNGDDYCEIVLKKDGSVMITSDDFITEKKSIWSTQGLTVGHEKQVLSTELSVNNDGLWLLNSYTDRTVKKFKAQEGTNSFALVQSENHEPSSIDL